MSEKLSFSYSSLITHYSSLLFRFHSQIFSLPFRDLHALVDRTAVGRALRAIEIDARLLIRHLLGHDFPSLASTPLGFFILGLQQLHKLAAPFVQTLRLTRLVAG